MNMNGIILGIQKTYNLFVKKDKKTPMLCVFEADSLNIPRMLAHIRSKLHEENGFILHRSRLTQLTKSELT